jgi:hypothetical protein
MTYLKCAKKKYGTNVTDVWQRPMTNNNAGAFCFAFLEFVDLLDRRIAGATVHENII